MLSILINAYACCPGMGSEQGMAWNWCSHLAKHCELHIITEEEYREKIETAVAELPQGRNMHFYWNPVTPEVRRMCWNQGDWWFYKHYREWQQRTYRLALDIVKNTHIDILHQLNMIGFREPGYLWKIEGIPFVWGPIGGLKQFPVEYLCGAGLKMNLFMRLKNIINIAQLKFTPRISKALHRADVLISSIPDSQQNLKKYKRLNSVIIPETGCFESKEVSAVNRFTNKYLRIIWVGKFDFRKRLDIALYAIANAANPYLHLQIFGTGSTTQVEHYKALSKNLGIDDIVEFMGNRTNDEVMQAMSESDVFLFTSVNEDTSTVVLEAVSRKLPVVCFDTCGMSYVITDKVGVKIPLSNPKDSSVHFAETLNDLYNNREKLLLFSKNCTEANQSLSWDNKVGQMLEIYTGILNRNENIK